MDPGHLNTLLRSGDDQDMSSSSVIGASNSAPVSPRAPSQQYYVYPKTHNDKEITDTEAYLKTLSGVEEVTPNRPSGELLSWTVVLSGDTTAAKLSEYPSIREVSLVTEDKKIQGEVKIYTVYAKEPGKDTQAIAEFLNSTVAEDKRELINELKDDEGKVEAWYSISLNEDGRKKVEARGGLDVYESVVYLSRALPEQDTVLHSMPRHKLSELNRKRTLVARQGPGQETVPGEWTVQKGTPEDPEAPAPADLIVVSQPTEFPDRTQLKDFVYEKKAGEGTFIYIIDQGVAGEAKNKFGNREFPESRIKYLQTSGSKRKGQKEKEDDNEPRGSSPGSHGTMMAAKAAGEHYGIAKGATIIAVKCTDEYPDQMLGFDMVKADINKGGLDERRRKSVVVYSSAHPDQNVQGQLVDSTKRRMRWFSDQGIPVVIAAGNEAGTSGRSEIDMIPMKLDSLLIQLINVGAADWDGNKRAASQAGPKVTLYAPGTDVPTMKKDGSELLEVGTSVAGPAVGGEIAVLMGRDSPPWGKFTEPTELVVEIKKKLKSSFSYERKKDSTINILWNGARKEDHEKAGARLPDGSGTEAKVKCNVLKDDTTTYMTRDTLSDLIRNTYCPKWEGLNGEIGPGSYLPNTPETVEIYADRDFSSEDQLTVDDCIKNLHKVLDDCDGDGSTNPMNWKAGGELKVDNWTYSLKMLHDRPAPYPRKPQAWCQIESCSSETQGCVARMWGAGWLNSGDGHELREAFEAQQYVWKDQMGDLPGIDTSKWGENWKYELMDGHEWTVTVPMNVGIFVKPPMEEQVVTIMKAANNAKDLDALDVKELVDGIRCKVI